MRRARRRNALFRQMPADAQIRRLFSFLDGLMPRSRFARCLLLCPNTLSQFAFARFKLAAHARDVFFHSGKFRVSSVQFFVCRTHRVSAAHACSHKFGTVVRKTRPFCHDSRGERFEIGGSRVKGVQIGKLFQEIAIGSFALLNAPLHPAELSLGYLCGALRLVTLLNKRLFLCFAFRTSVRLLTRDWLAFFFHLFYSFVNPRSLLTSFFLLLIHV